MPDLRGYLEELQVAGELVSIDAPISSAHQAAALLEQAGLDFGPAVQMRQVTGHPGCGVVGNLMGTRRRLALALGVAEAELDAAYADRRLTPVPPQPVADGPVRAVVVTRNVNVLEHVPVLTHYQEDAGPYVTAGAVIAREPGGSRLGMGIHRMQVKGPNRLGVFLASPPLSNYFRAAEAQNRPLEVAVALGAAPAVTLAAVARVRPEDDKMAVAGGLAGAPVALVKGVTVDVPAPADAEFVIEGRVLPGVRETDGPFGESTGTYLPFQSPVIEVTAITYRQRPLYQAILPWGAEVDLLMDLTVGTMLRTKLRELSPCVEDLRMSLGTCGLQAVVQVRPCRREEVRRALSLALTLDNHIKVAIAVDRDVDPMNLRDVTWAVATRMQPDRDLVLLQGMEGFSIDPSAQSGSTAKLGIDATIPAGEEHRYRRVAVPADARKWAQEIWQRRAAKE